MVSAIRGGGGLERYKEGLERYKEGLCCELIDGMKVSLVIV